MDNLDILKQLHLPASASHKGDNGRLLIIGGSKLFHAASIWSLTVASRIVDLVHYASTVENNQLVVKLKEEFRDGIVIPRGEIDYYIKEDDCILIGPGMVRTQEPVSGMNYHVSSIKDIESITDEGIQTYFYTKYLLQKYPEKKWVIDAGALQMLETSWIPENAILTPHKKEFEKLVSCATDMQESIINFSKEYKCTVLLKGKTDLIASAGKLKKVTGGNAGMTKGGTGDVLAGLVAALYCRNDAFISAAAASIINKKAGNELFEKSGFWFNASDLSNQIPRTMKKIILDAA